MSRMIAKGRSWRVSRVSLLAIGALALGCGSSNSSAPHTGKHDIWFMGAVIDGATGMPLTTYEISLVWGTNSVKGKVDASGRYTLGPLPAWNDYGVVISSSRLSRVQLVQRGHRAAGAGQHVAVGRRLHRRHHADVQLRRVAVSVDAGAAGSVDHGDRDRASTPKTAAGKIRLQPTSQPAIQSQPTRDPGAGLDQRRGSLRGRDQRRLHRRHVQGAGRDADLRRDLRA